MKIYFFITLLIFFISCKQEIKSDIPLQNDNPDNNSTVTWKDKFPSLWASAYAQNSTVRPEDVTYDQFLDAVANKLKQDGSFIQSTTGPQGASGLQGATGANGADGADGIFNLTQIAARGIPSVLVREPKTTYYITSNSYIRISNASLDNSGDVPISQKEIIFPNSIDSEVVFYVPFFSERKNDFGGQGGGACEQNLNDPLNQAFTCESVEVVLSFRCSGLDNCSSNSVFEVFPVAATDMSIKKIIVSSHNFQFSFYASISSSTLVIRRLGNDVNDTNSGSMRLMSPISIIKNKATDLKGTPYFPFK